MSKVLAIGAHYDDVEIGVGGTLYKHIEKDDEVVIAITDSDEWRTGHPEARRKEQLDALKTMGIPNSQLILFRNDAGIPEIINALDAENPDIVYTQFELDSHQAHRRCSQIGRAVSRKPDIQLFFYNSGSAYGFNPNAFSIIDCGWKFTLLNCFKSQIDMKVIDLSGIDLREHLWGSSIATKPCWAEAFVIGKMLV